MANASRDPILLTPGPLTTSLATKCAMLRDWGSWDSSFNAITASVRERVLGMVSGEHSHVCVPMQGSGTFSVEAAVNTLVPRDGHLLVLINGAYGKRLARLAQMMGRRTSVFETAEDVPTTARDVERLLTADPSVTHVGLIHCETSTGILNPLAEIAAVVARHGKSLIVDAMSSFGALPIDAGSMPFDALIAASGKCIEGPPGMGFVIARRAALEAHAAEGGPAARLARYARNCDMLVSGMKALGFRPFLDAAIQAPIIVTFHAPADTRYTFREFYDRVREKGYILYPGKLTQVETFRVGCIGVIGPDEMRQAVNAIGDTLREMGIERMAPADTK
jgi:2-aminoethylphosphonate-pyruvate transaminase